MLFGLVRLRILGFMFISKELFLKLQTLACE